MSVQEYDWEIERILQWLQQLREEIDHNGC